MRRGPGMACEGALPEGCCLVVWPVVWPLGSPNAFPLLVGWLAGLDPRSDFLGAQTNGSVGGFDTGSNRKNTGATGNHGSYGKSWVSSSLRSSCCLGSAVGLRESVADFGGNPLIHKVIHRLDLEHMWNILV